MKTGIELAGMRFYARHGVFQQEQEVGNWFLVNLSLSVDVTAAVQSDCLEETINYASVYQLVEEEMSIPSQLIEHVAGRIAQRIEVTFPSVQSLRIKVTKQTPPFKGQIGGVSVILEKENPLFSQH